MDMSFMAKFRGRGLRRRGDARPSSRAGAVNGETGRITYTQWLDDDGRIVADLTVTKLRADDELLRGRLRHRPRRTSWTWLRRGRTGSADVTRHATSPRTTPSSTSRARARATCSPRLTDADLSTEAFRFRTARLDRARRRRAALRADHLPRRAGLRALRAGRPTPCACTTPLLAAGAAYDIRPVGPQGAGLAADGEGLPRLRPRHRQHRLPARGRARLRARAGTSRAASSAGTPCSPARRPTRPPAGWPSGWCSSGCSIPSRCCTTRRSSTATASRSATSGRRRTAGRSASAVGLALVSGGGVPGHPRLAEAGDVGGRHRRRPAPAEVSLRPMYDPTSERVRA